MHQARSESPAYKGLSTITSCWSDKGDSHDIPNKETDNKATQIYLKKCEVGTHPPYVSDSEDFDHLLFTFAESVVQQAQQHMFQQLKQCMQQAYTGLTLGTPVRAQEYTEQFKKTNNTVVLTETKRLDVDNTPTEWNDQQDGASGGAQLLSSHLLPSPDLDSTTPKSIQESTNSFGGARHKTNRPQHSTAVISGQPAGSETDREYEDYFNPRIFTRSRLVATSPSFAAAVSLRRPHMQHPYKRSIGVHGTVDHMAEILDHKKRFTEGQRKKLPKDTQVIKTRNSPRSTYVRQFNKLSPNHNITMESDIYKRFDLATAFKGLTIIKFTDINTDNTVSTSTQKPQRPFSYPSPSPSPTTTEELQDLPQLVPNTELPLPNDILDDKISVENSDWSLPSVAFLPQLGKRQHISYSPDTVECKRCKQLYRKSWPGSNSQEEKCNDGQIV